MADKDCNTGVNVSVAAVVRGIRIGHAHTEPTLKNSHDIHKIMHTVLQYQVLYMSATS